MQNKTIKLSNSLNLNIVTETIKKESVKDEAKSTNFYFVWDNSGSMYSVIKQLRADLNNKSRNVIKTWDTITLAAFSSEGWDYKYFTVWFRKALEADFDTIEKLINQNFTASNLTCFSEVLNELPSIVDKVNAQYPGNNAFIFCTDGYPVTSNNKEEERKTLEALEVIKDKVDATVLVWYWDYYNRNLMSKMAEVVSWSLIHADEFKDFTISTDKFMETLSGSVKKIEVKTPTQIERSLVYSVENNTITNHKVLDNNTVSLFVDENASEITYAYFSKQAANEVLGKNDLLKADEYLTYLYSAVYALFKRMMKTEALELLVYLGDVYLIDKLNNALTNTENAIFEIELLQAVVNSEDSRFKEWRKADYLPSMNKFCLVELLDTLNSDEEAKFYPYNTAFKYRKTTQTYENKDKTYKFEADKTQWVAIRDLVWNEEQINLSIRVQINWTIDLSVLNNDFEKFNLPKTYRTFQWKNYSIVSDGNLNVKVLPVSMSQATFEKLQKVYVISKKETYEENKVYEIDLTKMPLVNKRMASQEFDAKEIAALAYEVEQISAKLKVVKTYTANKKEQSAEKFAAALWEEASKFLADIGITTSWYQPAKQAVEKETEDYRIARTFSLKVAWWSTLPSMNELNKRIAEWKALNAPQTVMKKELDTMEAAKSDTKVDVEALARKTIKSYEEALFPARSKIQQARFAVILGRTKFKNLEEWENPSVTLWLNKSNFCFLRKEN